MTIPTGTQLSKGGLEARRPLGLGPDGLRRVQNLPLRRQGYRRTVFRAMPRSSAIPRIEGPAPFIS